MKILIYLLLFALFANAIEPNYKTVKGVSVTQSKFNKTATQYFSYLLDLTTFDGVTADTLTTNLTLPKSILTDLYLVTTDSINSKNGVGVDSVLIKFWIGDFKFSGSGADTVLATYKLPTSLSPLTVTNKQYIQDNSALKIGIVNSKTNKSIVNGKMRIIGTYRFIE